MYRTLTAIIFAALACRANEPAPAAGSAVPAAGAAATALPIHDAQLATLLRATGTPGAALVTDVATGNVIASAAIGRDLAAPVLPLSVLKLYVAALWWEHQLGDGDFPYRGRRVTVHDLLVDGYDDPGKLMALALRQTLGGDAMLAELHRYGLDGLTLPANADDERWGSALSIGEHDALVTLAQVASFLRAVGDGTPLLQPTTQQRLQSAMRDAVTRGTAKSAGTRLTGTWQLGGKTGTGPADTDPHDGWFAGLIFDRNQPRYAIAVYIERHGLGGGIAASIAADVTLAAGQ